MIDVTTVFEENREALMLSWVCGRGGGSRTLSSDSIESADMVGHLNLIHPGRIQVLGVEEVGYYNRLDPGRRAFQTGELVAGRPPAVIVADDIVPPSELTAACNREDLPLFLTPLPAARVIDLMRIYLSRRLAERTEMHGVFMDVLGMGVLISGDSGLGKSELGLELVSRGHGLVADDVVEFLRVAPDVVEGRCPALLQNMLEVRGLGLLDIKTIFGESAVRRKMRLKLIVHLFRRSNPELEYERLPLSAQSQEVLGLPIRKVIIPVAAGRNLAVLVEAAVRNTILQLRGIDTTRDFVDRQQKLIAADEDGLAAP